MRSKAFPAHLLFALTALSAWSEAVAQEEAPPPATPGNFAAVGVFPLDGDLFTGRFVVYFNEPVAPLPPDLAPNAILFNPPLAGNVESGANYLSFSIDDGSEIPKGKYTVSLLPELRSASGAALSANPPPTWKYRTYRLDFEGFNVKPQANGVNFLEFRFSNRIDPEVFLKHSSIVDREGRAFEARAWTGSGFNTAAISLPDAENLPVKVTLKPSLPDKENLVQLGKEIVLTYPARGEISVTRAQWERSDYGRSNISLRFSENVFTSQLGSYLKLTADTGAQIEYSRRGNDAAADAVLNIDEDLEGVDRITLDISSGLPGPSNRVVATHYSVILEAKEPSPRIEYQYWNDDGLEGAVLTVRFTRAIELDEVKTMLSAEPLPEGWDIQPAYRATYKIRGEWKPGQEYALIFTPPAQDSASSNQDASPVRITLDPPPRVHGADFGYEGKIYFPRKTAGALPVTARNYEKVTVSAHALFPSNIVQAVAQLDNGQAESNFVENLAKPLGSKELNFAGPKDTNITHGVELGDLIPAGRKGVFALSLDPSHRYDATKVVVWTDLGLLAHWRDTELVVFAHDLFSLDPISGARITVHSSKHQLLAEGNTDARGIAHLRNLDSSLGVPRVVIAETSDDSTFLDLEKRTDDPVPFTEAMPLYDPEGYDAFIYTDRNLYRPGEIAHLRWMVRDGSGKVVPDVPLLLNVKSPLESSVHKETVTLSALGTGGADLETTKAYLTGKYEVALSVPGAAAPLTTATINLEDFVPTQIKGSLEVGEKLWLPKVEQSIQLTAEQLFGGPAAGRKCETTVILRKGQFKSEQWPGYHFGNDEEFTTVVESLGESKTDDEGKAAFTYTPSAKPEMTFPIEVTLSGQIFELGGRPVNTIAEALLLPDPVVLGMALVESEGQRGVDLSVIALNPDETPAGLGTVEAVLERESWIYNVRRFSSHNEPRWTRAFEPLEKRPVILENGRGTATFELPEGYGQYRIRVRAEGVQQSCTRSFYSYWRKIEVVDQMRPSLIAIKLDKESYTVGEEAVIRVESPFDGQGFVVIQGAEIQEVLPVHIENQVGTVHFLVSREQVPNAWIEATVVHNVEPGKPQVYPYSSFAAANLRVSSPDRRIEVALPGLPEEIRPGQDITVNIETHDAAGEAVPAEVTLAAVDEGIHLILDYANPDPYGWFQRDRQPDLRRAHYYDRVAYDFLAPQIGGDLIARRLGKDSAGIGENWIKPVALWSAPIRTDANGKGSVTLSVPEFSGQLRFVAVAASHSAVGTGTAQLYVRRPYILRTGLPRFLLPQDTFEARAVVFNRSEAPVTAQLRWSTYGVLGTDEGQEEFSVPAGKDTLQLVKLAASEAVGQGGIRWHCTLVDATGQMIEQLESDTPLPVLAPAAYQSELQSAVVAPGETRTFQNSQFVEDSRRRTTFTASADPMFRLKGGLDYVVGYPYGCVEQTTSRLMPLYLLREHEYLIQSALGQASRVDHYIRAGIDRLLSMQTASGGLATWPGGVDPYPYGSVYAGHFLTLLKRDRIYDIPEERFTALQDYIRSVSRDTLDSSPSGLYRRAYALYVLALDGDQEAIDAIGGLDSVNIPRTARYWLAAAIALHTQDLNRVQEYLATNPSELVSGRENSGNLNSDIRNTAVEVIATLQSGGAGASLSGQIDALLRYVEDHKRRTTQETAFVIAALSLYLAPEQGVVASAAAQIQGPVEVKELKGASVYQQKIDGPNRSYTVQNTGGAPIFVAFLLEGVPLKPPVEPVHEGLAIRRVLRDEKGVELPEGPLKQSATYIVQIEITCDEDAENLAVADLLPAGLEVANPRLDSESALAETIGESAVPAFLDVRDDRLIVVFDSLSQGVHSFYYVARAVSSGVFQQPAIYVDCMYDPAVHGASLPSMVTVE